MRKKISAKAGIFAQNLNTSIINLITDASDLSQFAEKRESENRAFRDYLMQLDEAILDDLTASINNEVAPQIDCTSCGACCRNLMIHVTQAENKRIADTLNMSTQAFEDQYVESGSSGTQIINAVPCHFLCDSKCRVYEQRYADCRAFPNLDQPRFKTRLFATLMHYGMCPIIFNVIEELKQQTQFFKANTYES